MYTEEQMATPIANMNIMVMHVVSALGGLCLFAGALIMLGGLYRWIERRKNPSAITLTEIVTLFMIGGALMCIQYLPMHGV